MKRLGISSTETSSEVDNVKHSEIEDQLDCVK